MVSSTAPPPTSIEEKQHHTKAPSSDGEEGPVEEFVFDEKEERRLVRKIDFLLMPILSLLYLLSFLDRSNLGNAKIEGLTTDLKISNYNYVNLLTVYFVGYVAAELPANWVLKITSPQLWLPTLTLVWGIVSVCMGLVHNEAGIFAARFFLGITEAGLFPGVLYVFSRFYKRKERTARVAFFFSAAAAAGAFGGVLAYGLAKMDGVGGKPGWAWIFIIEGLLTIVVSIAAYFLVPNYPHLSSKFTEREKLIIAARLRTDSDALDTEGFSWSEVWRAATSLQVWGYCFLFASFSFGLYTLSLFLPTIIVGLGYQSWQAQLLSTPPYVTAFLVTMTVAYFSTIRVGIRAPFIIGAACVSILGYIVLITSPTIGGRYTAVFLCAAGIYSGNALLLAWPSENLMGQTFRATALAMVISVGNGLGAIVGTQLYRVPLGGVANTNYHVSYGLTIVWLGFGIICTSSLWYGLSRANKRTIAERARAADEQKRAAGGASGDTSAAASASDVTLTADGQWRKTFLYQV